MTSSMMMMMMIMVMMMMMMARMFLYATDAVSAVFSDAPFLNRAIFCFWFPNVPRAEMCLALSLSIAACLRKSLTFFVYIFYFLYLFVCVFVPYIVHLSVCLSVWLSVCMFGYKMNCNYAYHKIDSLTESTSLSICLYVCLLVGLSIRHSVCRYVRLSGLMYSCFE